MKKPKGSRTAKSSGKLKGWQTLAEAAKEIEISRQRIHTLVATNRVPSLSIGGGKLLLVPKPFPKPTPLPLGRPRKVISK